MNQTDNTTPHFADAVVTSDFDALTQSGLYVGYNAKGAPLPSHQTLIWHARTTREYQISITQRTSAKGSTAHLWFRYRASTGWDEWYKIETVPKPYVEPSIVAAAGMIMHISDLPGVPNKTLYSKAPDKRIMPASITKVLTAVTAIRVLTALRIDLDNYQIAVTSADEVGGSGNNVKDGDIISFKDALKNMMLPSSNSTATAMARSVGSELVAGVGERVNHLKRFITEMNSVAADLGMANSNFNNASGLASSGQFSTVSDITLLMIEAAGLLQITDIWGAGSDKITITGPNARIENVTHSLKMIADPDVLGGKSGTLTPAIYSASLLIQAPSGNRIVATVLQSNTATQRYTDIRTMVDAVVSGVDWPIITPQLRGR
ncbi:D-alanyl-D-alanine carboxypeptidase [Sulfitobacter pseudonitzschiae]|uniref:D-alanyl-D-alanine carboxypeptidase n=1 Tax=Pseudosulfitobacter pseudonitzschiae TaxID=1402135 RepID=A0A9Q2RXT4_9RHOB|nr:serine hydrolase [Pseudosulfitobacter pseudonitzschiae]MBM2294833.1 D-alanyl-D-alanine carboxypeptidase [Pseudosulfitobacter pseudonitzschiae]MBM2299770.1 D-alanyl-D-alanine carboxypeptidase [Pseudosulfitobacter pseudonitzschiae]MBM2304670.1 D-alanyl-D-alanine carboxypeptidase [Pseudosulfitobacter pseudonitzschiae]MBM2314443.1 D-alanyl-D-alanine carboxypeptidase [Pseudosulfitobacter pseudonitzschiae]MBM2319339.1 D-alanyl-D-alanine carboxypeptidase [Pseudosulfitobacter pseudonitzschiae]